METMSMQRSSGGQDSGLSTFKNPKRRSSRRSLSRSGGSLALPTNQKTSSPPNYWQSQPPLLPLPLVNNSTLHVQRFTSSRPRVNNSTYAQKKVISETQKKRVEFFESVPKLTRTGSVPVWSDFPKGFDGYPGPAIILLSPPPSSLPMPRFSIKPKLRCNVEAVGKKDVATDNSRRVLQFR